VAKSHDSPRELPLVGRITKREGYGLGVFIAVCLAVSAVGSVFTMAGMDGWFEQLEEPAINPPGWVFGLVWSVLYLAMGVAAWMVWRARGLRGARLALGLFGVQLALNLAWTGIFFGRQAPGWAVVEIVMLWLAVAATLAVFWRHVPAAGALFVPYLAWVTFATVLNFEFWRLN
jgi:translocator protein